MAAKIAYMMHIGLEMTVETYNEKKTVLSTLGYHVEQVIENGIVTKMRFSIWQSIDFEVISLAVMFLLLRYYIGQTDNRKRGEAYHYIHHSLFLE